jgi:hypothetical protein
LLGLDTDGRPAKRALSARAQQLTILGDLSSALESKDPYTHGHSQRVERHSVRTAEQLGLSIEQLAEIRRAARLHDVGKIRVPHRILRKPSALTPEERKVIEQHTVVGAWLVSNVCKRDIVLAVRHHHERWDGRGYPDGLSGENIPLYARVIAVADAFDAMTSSRPYRLAYDSRTAIDILEAEAGAQFDPAVVRAFVATVPSRVPIAAFLPFFGVGLTRKLVGGTRRALNGTAVTGAAAAGAVSILIASLVTPIEAPLAQPNGRPQIAAPGSASPAGPSTVLADVTIRDGALDVTKEGAHAKDAPKRDAKKKSSSRDRSVKADSLKRKGKGKRDGELIVMSGNVSREPRSTSGPQPAAQQVSGPSSGSANGSGHQPPGDPQPSHGRDCPAQGPGAHAPGRIKHCG